MKTCPHEWLDRSFRILNCLMLSIVAFACLYPFYYAFIYSISAPDKAAEGISLLPAGISFMNYRTIFGFSNIVHAALISIARTILGTIITILCSSLFAYLVSQPKMRFRLIIYRFMMVTIYFNAGVIPYYLTMKSMGLMNNFMLYIIPSAIVPFFVILLKTYFESIPLTLAESAKMEGAGHMRTFICIILPLSSPIVATIALFSAVTQWGTFYDNLLLVGDPKLQTLQMILYNYLTTSQVIVNLAEMTYGTAAKAGTTYSVRATVTMITTFPILVVYPWLQKHFTKGVMIGAIKG